MNGADKDVWPTKGRGLEALRRLEDNTRIFPSRGRGPQAELAQVKDRGRTV